MVDLEVVGRHALLFDDDPVAAFVNSSDALVEWHSLLIDRYDVRHLLSSPPPPRKRRNPSPPSASSNEPELDHERYLDLPSPSEQLQDEVPKPDAAGSYSAVGFSYGGTDYPTDEKSDVGQGDSSFRPPFTVPDILLQSLPPTEKLHQIIARTAMFVSKHGGQSEIVLRVKQGDNPTFGFLMPDHNLHPYFRFLVDHQELLQSEADGKPETEKKDPKNTNQTDSAGAGALSLLGSVYGNDEDEDASEAKETVYGEVSDPSGARVTHDSKESEAHGNGNPKDDTVAKHPSPPKQKTQLLKRTSSTTLFKGGTLRAKKSDTVGLLSADAGKPKPSLPSETAKVKKLVVEPPSDLKSLVERLVEFIMRNGKQFEAVLIEQDRTHGRFPFLLPSNLYHPYYLKVLQEAQESKKKDDSAVKKQDKKSSVLKENEQSAGCDMPFDSDRKEKFRMVLGKSKRDGQDQPSCATQSQFGVSVDADQAAAILQAATRGIRNPNFGIISSKLLNGNSNSGNNEGGQASSLGSRPSSYQGERKGDQSVSVPFPVAKAIAKTAAIEAANEADSSEAHLTKEQKLKADRLKRAKMFVSMLKSGSTTSKAESSRSLSVEPQEHAAAGSDSIAADKREGSVVHLDIGTLSQIDKSDKKHSDDEFHERRSRRTYRSRFGKEEEEEDEDEVEEKDKGASEEEEEEKDHRHTKKHRSSRKGREEEEDRDHHRHARKKHRSRRSSSREDESKEERNHKHSRKRHRSSHKEEDREEEEEEEEERHHRHSRRKHQSRRSSRSDKDGRKHRDRDSSRHRSKHEKSSDEERHRESDSTRHRKKSRSEELEEGEISGKTVEESRGSVGGAVVVSREASVDLQSLYQDGRAPSLASAPTEVSNDLRAKVRAMLMATR